jgi:hypothetical protein
MPLIPPREACRGGAAPVCLPEITVFLTQRSYRNVKKSRQFKLRSGVLVMSRSRPARQRPLPTALFSVRNRPLMLVLRFRRDSSAKILTSFASACPHAA